MRQVHGIRPRGQALSCLCRHRFYVSIGSGSIGRGGFIPTATSRSRNSQSIPKCDLCKLYKIVTAMFGGGTKQAQYWERRDPTHEANTSVMRAKNRHLFRLSDK
jgi:hypothetical protein